MLGPNQSPYSDMDYCEIITNEPGQLSRKPCLRGMRITVTGGLEFLAGAIMVPQILADFPELMEQNFRAWLALTLDRVKSTGKHPCADHQSEAYCRDGNVVCQNTVGESKAL